MRKLIGKILHGLADVLYPPTPGINIEELVADAEVIESKYNGPITNQSLEQSRTYSSFSGCDTTIWIADEPFKWENRQKARKAAEPLSTAQAISWAITKGSATGTIIELNLDGHPAQDLAGKTLLVVSANEYGKAAVLAAFHIEEISCVHSGLGVDDYVIERTITWAGSYLPNYVGPVIQGEEPNA